MRIQGDSLRLRLTRGEVAGLHQNGMVAETAHFAVGGSLTYRILRRAGSKGIGAELNDGTITIHIPPDRVDAWATSDEVGITARQGVLRIAIEKDFRCLTRPKEEDEPDAYPHPAEAANS